MTTLRVIDVVIHDDKFGDEELAMESSLRSVILDRVLIILLT